MYAITLGTKMDKISVFQLKITLFNRLQKKEAVLNSRVCCCFCMIK